jgi:hypothetical protein
MKQGSNVHFSLIGILWKSGFPTGWSQDLPNTCHPRYWIVRTVEDRTVSIISPRCPHRPCCQDLGTCPTMDEDLQGAARHPNAPGQFWCWARQPPGVGLGQNERSWHQVSWRPHPRGLLVCLIRGRSWQKKLGVQNRTECRPWNIRAQGSPKGAFLTLLSPVTKPPCWKKSDFKMRHGFPY